MPLTLRHGDGCLVSTGRRKCFERRGRAEVAAVGELQLVAIEETIRIGGRGGTREDGSRRYVWHRGYCDIGHRWNVTRFGDYVQRRTGRGVSGGVERLHGNLVRAGEHFQRSVERVAVCRIG